MKLSHNELIAHRHLFIVVIVALICVSSFALFLHAYTSTRNQITTNYRQTFEKKSWSGLEIFHQAIQAAIQEYFSKNLSIVTNIANDTEFYTALGKHDMSFVKEILDGQKRINQRFNNFSILDKKGIFMFSTSTSEDAKKLVGQDFSSRNYFRETVQKKHPVITTLYGSALGKDLVFFSAPIIGPEGDVDYVVNGTVFLSDLGDKMPIKNTFEDFGILLADQSGNIFFSGNDDVTFEKFSGHQNPIITRLINGEDEILSEFITDKQKILFAKGSIIPIGNDDKLFLVSSFDKAQFEADILQLQQKVSDIYSGLGIRVLVFGLPSLCFIIYILKRHDWASHHL